MGRGRGEQEAIDFGQIDRVGLNTLDTLAELMAEAKARFSDFSASLRGKNGYLGKDERRPLMEKLASLLSDEGAQALLRRKDEREILADTLLYEVLGGVQKFPRRYLLISGHTNANTPLICHEYDKRILHLRYDAQKAMTLCRQTGFINEESWQMWEPRGEWQADTYGRCAECERLLAPLEPTDPLTIACAETTDFNVLGDSGRELLFTDELGGQIEKELERLTSDTALEEDDRYFALYRLFDHTLPNTGTVMGQNVAAEMIREGIGVSFTAVLNEAEDTFTPEQIAALEGVQQALYATTGIQPDQQRDDDLLFVSVSEQALAQNVFDKVAPKPFPGVERIDYAALLIAEGLPQAVKHLPQEVFGLANQLPSAQRMLRLWSAHPATEALLADELKVSPF